jgi:preprotein translocase subunit SecE
MDHMEKEALAFVLAVLAVVAGLAVFYFAGLDQQITKVRAGSA